jgi:hypothetical protein
MSVLLTSLDMLKNVLITPDLVGIRHLRRCYKLCHELQGKPGISTPSLAVADDQSDESRKHHGVVSWSMPDCVDFKLKTPNPGLTL